MALNAIDIFSGCGGMTEGLKKAGFDVIVGIDNDNNAIITYSSNHAKTEILNDDISNIEAITIKILLDGKPLHLLAGCPPCQGFSTVRKLNGKNVKDPRNALIFEYYRIVKLLMPSTIMLENVPGLAKYYRFNEFIDSLTKIGYYIDYNLVNVKNYGVPQKRKRFVLVGSLLGEIKIDTGVYEIKTVRDAIGKLQTPSKTKDPLQRIISKHTDHVKKIISHIPKNGGSRSSLPGDLVLECHKSDDIGFKDIYGRLRWDDFSSTITGGCLNPSKGRFLHPEQNRAITPREAALLQSFPADYKFPTNISKTALAVLIGNALPPRFAYIQAKNIKEHLDKHLA